MKVLSFFLLFGVVWKQLSSAKLKRNSVLGGLQLYVPQMEWTAGWQRTIFSPALVFNSIADKSCLDESSPKQKCGADFVWISVEGPDVTLRALL